MPECDDDPSRSDFDPGSFRDPLSRVLLAGDRVMRVLRGDGVADFAALEAADFYAAAQSDGSIVATHRTQVPPGAADDGWEVALDHERVPVVTYPYEWTFAMLQDAALQQLRLTRAALAEGLLTKDATPYNTQFLGARPVFIDVGSFERLPAGEPWRGYRQFCQLFYNPLLLQATRGVPFQPLLRGSLEGITPSETRGFLRGRELVGKGAFTNVVLHARAERAFADSTRDVGAELKRAGFGPALIDAQLRKLERIVGKLEWGAATSTWSDYSDRAHYGAADLAEKERFVTEVASARPRRQILDLGANDGHFSRLVADHAEVVVAVDSDDLVVDRLYRRLRDERDVTIVPVRMNLADPSPSLGWRVRERPAFVDRVDADLVLALALVHHLAISATVPLAGVVAMLADHATRGTTADVVVEFPTPADPMVRRLLQRKRAGRFAHYRLDAFEEAVAERFDTVRRIELPSGTRHLFHLSARR